MIRQGVKSHAAIKASLEKGLKELTGAAARRRRLEDLLRARRRRRDQGGPQRPARMRIPRLSSCSRSSRGSKRPESRPGTCSFTIAIAASSWPPVTRRSCPADIRWGGLTPEGGDQFQLDFPSFRNDPIAGYDPDAFVKMDLIPYGDDPKDDRKYRSHLGKLVTRVVNKIVAIPVVKDHHAAGVTGALKNMSHGSVNNVARSHSNNFTNVCNQFIPQVVANPIIREKFVLHIMDGIRGVYHGGPFAWARDEGKWCWEYNALLLATDPVALDHIEWDIVDAKRVQQKIAPGRRTGKLAGRSAGRRGIRRSSASAHRPRRRSGYGQLREDIVAPRPQVPDPAQDGHGLNQLRRLVFMPSDCDFSATDASR